MFEPPVLRHPLEYFQWAMSVPFGTPTAETAIAICAMRRVNPLDYVSTPFGSLSQWQAIILEAVLMSAIARENPR